MVLSAMKCEAAAAANNMGGDLELKKLICNIFIFQRKKKNSTKTKFREEKKKSTD